ncbi:MAG: transposase [Candidatus Obscuribacterales bacterium]|nr:transposase [Candidatus Obscuribacterales bacterium]
MRRQWSPQELQESWALAPSKAWAERMTPEDYRGLSPLVRAHINPYGIFSLDIEKRLALKAA